MNTTVTSITNDFVAGNVKNAMSDGVGKKNDMYMVKFSELYIMEDFNVRPKNDEYYAAVRTYADSIKANGYYSHKPFAVIIIKIDGADRIAVYDGHTRYDAVQLAISEGAEIDRVPAVAARAGTTLEDITVGLVTNNNGNKIDPLALGVLCKRLIGFGRDNTYIANRLGFTPAYVGNLLSLAGAPQTIRDMVYSGKVSASLAVETLRDNGENAVAVLQSGMEVAVAAGKTKVTKKSLPTSDKPKKSQVDAIVAKGLDWIDNNGQMDSSYALLAALTGKTIEELKKI